MSKEEYEAIISLDKQNIIDYMKDVKTESSNENIEREIDMSQFTEL